VFPFIKTLGSNGGTDEEGDSTYSHHMRDAIFVMPTARVWDAEGSVARPKLAVAVQRVVAAEARGPVGRTAGRVRALSASGLAVVAASAG
jgi:hypothetical protein